MTNTMPQTSQVEVKINSVNFICDWKYNIQSENMSCCFCSKHTSSEYQPKSQRKCLLKVYGLVSGKCGHLAHLSCYKARVRRHYCYCNYCNEGNERVIFEFDKNLEENHTQKMYRV
jgi:hypothetical protein